MKVKILSLILAVSCNLQIVAQELIVIAEMRNHIVSSGDSLIAVSTFGDPFSGTSIENGIVVSTDIPIHLLFREVMTSVPDLPIIEGINAYPNPLHNLLILERNDVSTTFHLTITGINSTNPTEYTWESGNAKFELDIGKLIPGLYQVLITNEKITQARMFRIVKQ